MITRQYRQNESGDDVLVHTAEVEYYSFLQAGGHVVKVNDSTTIQVITWRHEREKSMASSTSVMRSSWLPQCKFSIAANVNKSLPYSACQRTHFATLPRNAPAAAAEEYTKLFCVSLVVNVFVP